MGFNSGFKGLTLNHDARNHAFKKKKIRIVLRDLPSSRKRLLKSPDDQNIWILKNKLMKFQRLDTVTEPRNMQIYAYVHECSGKQCYVTVILTTGLANKLENKANLVHNSFLVYLSTYICFGRLCAHHQEKQLCLCDTWYLSFCVDGCLVYRVE